MAIVTLRKNSFRYELRHSYLHNLWFPGFLFDSNAVFCVFFPFLSNTFDARYDDEGVTVLKINNSLWLLRRTGSWTIHTHIFHYIVYTLHINWFFFGFVFLPWVSTRPNNNGFFRAIIIKIHLAINDLQNVPSFAHSSWNSTISTQRDKDHAHYCSRHQYTHLNLSKILLLMCTITHFLLWNIYIRNHT